MKTITRKAKNLLCLNQNCCKPFLLMIAVCSLQANATLASNTTLNKSKSMLLAETNRVWINVTDTQGAFSQTLFGYRSGATDGYDHALDGAYMNDGAIALASMIDNVRYAIQFKGLPFSAADVVPLSFTASYTGTYTFAIDHMDGFFLNSTFAVYIHDTQTGTYTNLKTSGYTFTSTTGTYNNRFQLTYATSSTALGVNSNTFTANDLKIYQTNANMVINSGDTLLKDIAVYNINGQLLYQNSKADSNEATVANFSQNKQAVIVKVTTQDGAVVAKKWLFQ